MANVTDSPAKRRRLSSVHVAKTADLPNISGDLVQVTAGGHASTGLTAGGSSRPLRELSEYPLAEETGIEEDDVDNSEPEGDVAAESSGDEANARAAVLEAGEDDIGDDNDSGNIDKNTENNYENNEGSVGNDYNDENNEAAGNAAYNAKASVTIEEPRWPITIFNVHRSVLCKSSRHLQQKMQPAQGGCAVTQVDLAGHDPKLVEHYIQWLYTGKIAVEEIPLMVDGVERLVTGQLNLIHNYLLGERLEDTTYRNAVMRVLIHSFDTDKLYPTATVARTIYEGTNEKSPLRTLLIDVWVCKANVHWTPSDLQSLGLEFAFDILCALTTHRYTIEQVARIVQIHRADPNKVIEAKLPWIHTPEKYDVDNHELRGRKRPSGSWTQM